MSQKPTIVSMIEISKKRIRAENQIRGMRDANSIVLGLKIEGGHSLSRG